MQMNERDKIVERILADFSTQITASMYWKLFIFRYFSHHTQKKDNPPKTIKEKIEEECENKIIYERFPLISKENLSKEANTYMDGNNLKIRRHQGKCASIYHLPELLGVSNVQKLFRQKFISPYVAGFYGLKWETTWGLALQEKYFHTNKYNIPLTTSKDESALLEYYLTDSGLVFYFVYTAVQKYNIPTDALNIRADRRYNRTVFFYLLKSEEIKEKDDKKLIVTYLNSSKKSWGGKNKGIDLNYYLSKLMTDAKKDTGNSKRLVFFVYLQKNYAKKYFTLNQAPTPYPVFFFSSYTNILNDLKKLHFKDEEIQTRQKN